MKLLNNIKTFKSGKHADNNCSASGDVLSTIQYILEKCPKVENIQITSALYENAKRFGTLLEILRICKSRDVILDRIVGLQSESEQFIKVYGNGIIAESLPITA